MERQPYHDYTWWPTEPQTADIAEPQSPEQLQTVRAIYINFDPSHTDRLVPRIPKD